MKSKNKRPVFNLKESLLCLGFMDIGASDLFARETIKLAYSPMFSVDADAAFVADFRGIPASCLTIVIIVCCLPMSYGVLGQCV